MKELDELLTDPRIRVRREGAPDPSGRCVVYWMQRAQRGVDNPALNAAIEAANALGLPVAVFFGLLPHYPHANLRHYSFLVDGIAETRDRVERRHCAFVFRPYPNHDLIKFCREVKAALVIGDENPLREPESWRQSATRKLKVPFWTVDADVIIPQTFFPKEEYAARTIRPKIHRLLPVFFHPLANPRARHEWTPMDRPASHPIDPHQILANLPLDRSTSPVSEYRGGTKEGQRRLRLFIKNRLANYETGRNHPDQSWTSELSAYLHFGHLGPHTIAVAVREADAPPAAKEAYLEELIVRREVAINFVARNPQYDQLAGCPEWGRKTLAEHELDPRPDLYSEAQLEAAETGDPLWNASQQEMVLTGRMHGYLRMYWAKKILEWTATPEEAFEIAVRLNDRYELDGRDPNGYTGIAWAIGGKHDRPWAPKRPVFGLIRYMSAAGCARKFDVRAYIGRIDGLMRKRG
jgi:deoxyribodipyrimidine photo-lyase